MAEYDLRIKERASDALDALDLTVGRRVMKRIRWLANNLDDITPLPLVGDLAGLYKLRVGDYRVIYEINRDHHAIVIQMIGHRSDIYRHYP